MAIVYINDKKALMKGPQHWSCFVSGLKWTPHDTRQNNHLTFESLKLTSHVQTKINHTFQYLKGDKYKDLAK